MKKLVSMLLALAMVLTLIVLLAGRRKLCA